MLQNELRAAFDGDSEPRKNIALRRASDRLAELEAEVARLTQRGNNWRDEARAELRRRLAAEREAEALKAENAALQLTVPPLRS